MTHLPTALSHSAVSTLPSSFAHQNAIEKPNVGEAFVDVLIDLQGREAKNPDVELTGDEITSDAEPPEGEDPTAVGEVEISLEVDDLSKVSEEPPESSEAMGTDPSKGELEHTIEFPPIVLQTLMESAVNADVAQSETVKVVAAANGNVIQALQSVGPRDKVHLDASATAPSVALPTSDKVASHSSAAMPLTAPASNPADQATLPLAATVSDGIGDKTRQESPKSELEMPRQTSAASPASLPPRGTMHMVTSKPDGLSNTFLSQPELQSLNLPDDPLTELSLRSAPIQLAQVGLTSATLASPPQSHAPQVAHQIAAATLRSQGGTTEIALNPKELGRVRMTLTTTEGGVSVSILAERPETADLMRRNVEHLAREFQELGYDQISFSFGDQSEGADQSSQDGRNSDPSHDPMAAEQPLIGPIMTVAINGGLDLKL